MSPIIEMKDICYAYDDNIVLRHLNLNVNKGECWVLCGPNGCGKSTLLKILNGILFPNEGSYNFKDLAITKELLKDDLILKKFHSEIGFIFQDADTQLFCSSVYDEIAFGPMQMGLSESKVDERVNDCLKLLDIKHLKDRAPYHLSGGEKRKVAIACILSMNPEVLCFDEPLTGLDKESQNWFIEFMKLLIQSGKTLIIATHNDRVVNELATNVYTF